MVGNTEAITCGFTAMTRSRASTPIGGTACASIPAPVRNAALSSEGDRARTRTPSGPAQQCGAFLRRRRVDDPHRLRLEAVLQPASKEGAAHFAGADED